MTRVLLYVRVSTNGQTTENQTRELHAACEQRGWKIVAEFADNGISGAKDRAGRPGFDGLYNALKLKKPDVVAVWSIDRIGRSLSQLVAFMEELRRAEVDLYVHTQGVDTTTPGGRAMYQMIGVFAEFEREMIRARVKAGMARAREAGSKLGHPITPMEAKICEMLDDGASFASIRRATGCGNSAIQRIRGSVENG